MSEMSKILTYIKHFFSSNFLYHAMELISWLIPFIVLTLSVFAILRTWLTSARTGGIPGGRGWPIIGESLSFISDFSSPSGIYSFISKRQQRFVTAALLLSTVVSYVPF